MAHPYLEDLKILANRHLKGQSDIECKHFFSGAALYANGEICVSLTPVGLAFKLSEDLCAELIESGAASPLRYFANSPVKKGYVLFPDFIDLDTRFLSQYFRKAITRSTSDKRGG
ncbi:MAG: TfoX/Sxy family protein [Gammaproteobacteria bacterium]|nr:TfoX/Sxy family protein [Gammaproteobacteria bacterium]MCZ6855796.1 TfoX/Sxy family protein [Gammaproteobacteria bacterium]